jgi:hypothetical protein
MPLLWMTLNLNERHFMDGAVSIERLEYFVELNVSGLSISSTDSPYIYLCRSKTNLNISNLVLRIGRTPR